MMGAATVKTSLPQLLALQARIIAALVIRETRAAFGTSQIGYLWELILPAANVAILVFIMSHLGRQPPFGQSLALFFSTGIIILYFFRKLSASVMKAFDANKALLTYPPIKETDTLFARAILITLTYAALSVIFFGTLIALGMAQFPHRPEVVMQAFAVSALFGFGFGMFNAVFLSFWASWDKIVAILTRPLLFLSAIFYIPSNLPPHIVAILKWNPLLHLVEWMRIGYYSNYDSMVFSPQYPIILSFVMILIGLGGERLFRNMRSR